MLFRSQDFSVVRDEVLQKLDNPENMGLEWVAKSLIDIDAEQQELLEKLIDALEEDDDVQNIYVNI